MERSKRFSMAASVAGIGVSLLSASTSWADVLAAWDFGTVESPTFAATTVASGVTASNIAHNNPTASPYFTTADLNNPSYTTTTGASPDGTVLHVRGVHTRNIASLNGNKPLTDLNPSSSITDYFTASITAEDSAIFSISTITFDYSLSKTDGTTSNRGFVLYYSTDGFQTWTYLGGDFSSTSGDNLFKHVEYAINLENATTIEFRWYTGRSGSGTPVDGNTNTDIQFDNIAFNGVLDAVAAPEPAAIGILAAGMATTLLRRRR